MASVEVMISGVLYDKYSRTSRPVLLVGEASLAGLGVGGGPIIPGQPPPGIWPNPPEGIAPHPEHPIVLPPGSPPGIWGPNPGFPTPPIVLPPDQVPPGMQPPTTPLPGDPTKPVPPPAGSAGWPVQPIQPPAYLVINYPGIGPVYVAPPASAQPQMAKK